MRSIPRALVITALAVAMPATLVLAQSQAEDASTPVASAASTTSPTRHERLLEGKFALVKTTLKLNDAQLKLWTPVEEQLRAAQAKRAEKRESWREKRKAWRDKRQERRAERSSEDRTKEKMEKRAKKRVSLPDRLERRSKRLSERAERMAKFAEVLKPFYESLDAEQQALAGRVMHQFHVDGMRSGRGHHHHGRRWATRGWDRH